MKTAAMTSLQRRWRGLYSPLTLTQRLSAVFAILLLACCGASAWLQVRSSDLHEKEVVQSLSRGLAQHIAQGSSLMDENGLRADAVRQLFGQLMRVNPSVEVYLLDNQGRVTGDDAPPGHLKRMSVDLRPVRRFIADGALPILGDDPRSLTGRKVFSAAPLQIPGQPPSGYIYVVLLGEAHDALAARIAAQSILRTTLLSMGVVALLGLLAGLLALRLITRPLRRLTSAVRGFDAEGAMAAAAPLAAGSGDEIKLLESSFAQLEERIGEQWRALRVQEQHRRELIASLSHDLRTPLTSLHGYLETLQLKAETLEPAERRRYLGIALAQSTKVGRLAQALFELARLEHGDVHAIIEPFSLIDLLQDVFQKFELAAEAKHHQLHANMPEGLSRFPTVHADLAMIERVLTNLIDNAIRHTPERGVIDVDLIVHSDTVEVTIHDTGPGIPAEQREGLFERPVLSGQHIDGTAYRPPRVGGFGLLIVRRMLQLHGQTITLTDNRKTGAGFTFCLATKPAKVAKAIY